MGLYLLFEDEGDSVECSFAEVLSGALERNMKMIIFQCLDYSCEALFEHSPYAR
jgi:hypothetical protein